VVVVEIGRKRPAQMAFVENNDVVQTLPPDRTDARSTYGFCQGERGAITTSAMSITATRLLKTSLYEASRSRRR